MTSLSGKIDLVQQYLDVRAASHAIHASNIGNEETPNYKAKIPNFKVHLDHAIHPSGENGAASSTEPKLKLEMDVKTSQAAPRDDGNNVNSNLEMSAVAENGLLYMAAIKVLNKEMAFARYAITGGGN